MKGGGKRDFAYVTQRSRGGGKNVGFKIGGRGGGGPQGPPLDPHLHIFETPVRSVLHLCNSW